MCSDIYPLEGIGGREGWEGVEWHMLRLHFEEVHFYGERIFRESHIIVGLKFGSTLIKSNMEVIIKMNIAFELKF